MISVPMRYGQGHSRQTLSSLNQVSTQRIYQRNTILNLNQYKQKEHGGGAPPPASSPPTVARQAIPALVHEIVKGQKAPLPVSAASKLRFCLGWNVSNPACELDVSAFLLGESGKVVGDAWFVFYGQTASPDGSTRFAETSGPDREMISIDLGKLNPAVSKIVFVLTINEALERRLNFSMVSDAYIRVLDAGSGAELVSFKMTDYYSNVTSMMIGEVYLHGGKWKFNAVGNGVSRDLAGLCELYGVETE